MTVFTTKPKRKQLKKSDPKPAQLPARKPDSRPTLNIDQVVDLGNGRFKFNRSIANLPNGESQLPARKSDSKPTLKIDEVVDLGDKKFTFNRSIANLPAGAKTHLPIQSPPINKADNVKVEIIRKLIKGSK